MAALLAERSALPTRLEGQVAQLEADFALQFGQKPDFLVRVPGRVNLIGRQGHSSVLLRSLVGLTSKVRRTFTLLLVCLW